MPKTILITKPSFDDATHYLSAWTKPVITEATSRGFTICKMDSPNCTQIEFEKRITQNSPSLILFNGHGSHSTVMGHNKEVLVERGKNEHLLKNKIVHAFACSSANRLGPASITKGALAYIGFEQDFVFLQDDTHTANPLKDNVAKYFLESTNVTPISLIKGNTVKESFQKSQAAFDKAILFFETHYDVKNSHILFWLRYDKMIHKYHGLDNITINSV